MRSAARSGQRGRVRRRLTRLLAEITAVVAVGAGLVAVQTSTAGPAQALVATDVQRAYQYAASVRVHSGIAVLDTRTGQFWGAGDYGGTTFASESIIKAFIAARLLVMGQMHGSTAAVAYKMITQSDDASANALYGRVGGDSLINWVKAYYRIPFLGSPPSKPGWWGNTHVSPAGYVYFLARAKADPVVGPWLLNAMHHATTYGSDGFYQQFGIPQATTGAAIKQGWGGDDDRANSTELNSTGYVEGDRYAVALFAQHIPATSWSSVMNTINEMARRTMPGGGIDNPSDHNPVSHIDAIYATGNTLTIRGWAFDPDLKGSPIITSVFEGSVRTQVFWADEVRPDVNAAYRLTGNHGINVSFPTSDGTHVYCLQFNSIALGPGIPRSCYKIRVSGTPIGVLDTAAISSSNVARVTGWAFDPDSTATSVQVAVTDNGVSRGTFTASASRPDVNSVMRVSGAHGFDIAFAGATGAHTYCVSVINIGPVAHPNRSLGCKVATRPAAAVGAQRIPSTPGSTPGSTTSGSSPGSAVPTSGAPGTPTTGTSTASTSTTSTSTTSTSSAGTSTAGTSTASTSTASTSTPSTAGAAPTANR